MYHRPTSTSTPADPTVQETLLWDRKSEGGFPETKELKNRVRNVIEPDRDLGHIDRSLKKGKGPEEGKAETGAASMPGKEEQPLVGSVQDTDKAATQGNCVDC